MALQHAHGGPCSSWEAISDSTDAEVSQVLNASQALKLAKPTGKYQDAVMALCAYAAGKWPNRQNPQSLDGVAAYKVFTINDIVCPLVLPAIIAAPLSHVAITLS